MDDIVKAAIKKWPHVPHCHDWLALDARGDWYLRDEPVQAAGPFPQSKGQRVVHDKLKAFIERNYEHDEQGAWFFQNGPQRVYVTLEVSPLVWGVRRVIDAASGTASFAWQAHTGLDARELRSAWLDEQGRLFIDTDVGFGLVRSMDMDVAADALSGGDVEPLDCRFADLPARFGYQLHPQPRA